jgi:hypothetical protein
MICGACLRDNNRYAKYCCECGRGLIGQPEDPAPIPAGVWSNRARRCAYCEETIPARSWYCAECGITPTLGAQRNPGLQVLLGAVVLTFLVITGVFVKRLLPRHHFSSEREIAASGQAKAINLLGPIAAGN